MNAMQALAEFKQNLHHAPQPAHAPLSGRPTLPVTHSASVKSADSTTGSGSDTDSSTITANDFLQLLVAEMKNQDPTADQDPNAYIDQLVQVNSLQQLISINQDLTPASSTTTGGIASPATASEATNRSGPQLGSAAGTPAASVATALAPRAAQPAAAAIPALASGSAPSPAAVSTPAPVPATTQKSAIVQALDFLRSRVFP